MIILRIIKYLVISILLLSIITVPIFYILLNTDSNANSKTAIFLRTTYTSLYYFFNKRLTDNEVTPRTYRQLDKFEVQKWSDRYLYKFTGTFVDVETSGNIIHLKSTNGEIFSFLLSKEYIERQEQFIFENHDIYMPLVSKINIDKTQLDTSTSVSVHWDDTRKLNEIIADYEKNKTIPLNLKSTKYFGFNRLIK